MVKSGVEAAEFVGAVEEAHGSNYGFYDYIQSHNHDRTNAGELERHADEPLGTFRPPAGGAMPTGGRRSLTYASQG